MNIFAGTLELIEINASKKRELIEYAAYSGVAFAVPFALGHPQLLVGTIVNASLILAALNLKNQKLIPVILLPSFAVLSRGLIFGPFTMFLVYTIPFVWIGNSILVFSIKYFYLAQKWNKYLSMALGITAKVLILYLSAIIMIKLGILPKVFATSMGVFQLYTALAGCALALITQKLIKSK